MIDGKLEDKEIKAIADYIEPVVTLFGYDALIRILEAGKSASPKPSKGIIEYATKKPQRGKHV
jgi:hypothetical protein